MTVRRFRYSKELGKVIEITETPPEAKGFKPFFDESSGKFIESLDQIKKIEKKGFVYMNHEEAEKETKRNMEFKQKLMKEQCDKKYFEKIKKYL